MDEAVHWTAKVAEQGHTGAQYHLAANYAVGDDIAQDLRKARKWYRLAARLGHEEAAYNLGWMLILGEGGRSDAAAGMKQLAKAADGGSLDAMDLIAEIHAGGLYGQPSDPERAAGRFITAIAAGNRRSARNLAASLSEGRIDHGALKTALLRWAADTD
jgi:TPR repeat protein